MRRGLESEYGAQAGSQDESVQASVEQAAAPETIEGLGSVAARNSWDEGTVDDINKKLKDHPTKGPYTADAAGLRQFQKDHRVRNPTTAMDPVDRNTNREIERCLDQKTRPPEAV